MKWEYQLIRDMLARADMYLETRSFLNYKTGAMLRQAARVMTDWDQKLLFMEIALREIANLENTLFNNHSDEMQQIARKVLAKWGSHQFGDATEMEVQK